MFPSLYISNVKHQTKQMLFGLVVWSADLMHQYFWNSQASYIIITMVTDSTNVRYIWYHKLLVFMFVRGYGGEAPLTTCQHCLTFSCSRKGPQPLFHVTSPTMYSKHSKTKKWHIPKIIINRHIAILSFTFVLIWEQYVHLTLFSIANNVTYFKCLFLGSFLPPNLIWDFPYCRGMTCHLHFRRHIRLTNYDFCTHVVYCITIHYHICHIDKYRHVEGPICHNFRR